MHGHSRTIRRITQGLAVAAALATVSVALMPSSQAGIPAPWEVHKKIHKHVERRARQIIDLPRRIHSRHVREFKNFYSGRSYYGPHRHFHTVYRFPVDVGHRVVYRPYTYCNDGLFVRSYAGLPRLAVEVYPGTPVYYGPPVVYAPAPSYYEDRYDRDRYDDRRYDRHRRGHDDHRDDHRWDD